MKNSGIGIVGVGNRRKECSRVDSAGGWCGRNFGGGGKFWPRWQWRCAWEMRGILVAGRGGRRWRRMGLGVLTGVPWRANRKEIVGGGGEGGEERGGDGRRGWRCCVLAAAA